jgi:hypothetical protein
MVLRYPTRGPPSRTWRIRFCNRNCSRHRRHFADLRAPANLSESISQMIGHSYLILFECRLTLCLLHYCVMLTPITRFPGSTLTSIVYHIDVLMSKSNLI